MILGGRTLTPPKPSIYMGGASIPPHTPPNFKSASGLPTNWLFNTTPIKQPITNKPGNRRPTKNVGGAAALPTTMGGSGGRGGALP